MVFVHWNAGRGSQEVDMQRMWMRALVLAAVGAVTVFVVDDAQAGHRRRGGCGSSGGYYNGYSNGYGYYGGYRDGYTYGGGYSNSYGAWGPGVYTRRGAVGATYDANGRLIVPDRSARAGVGVDANAPVGGQTSPSDRTSAGAAAGANIRSDADVRGGADVNRNDGTIRGNAKADANLRGTTTPPAAPPVDAPPAPPSTRDGTLPPPVPAP